MREFPALAFNVMQNLIFHVIFEYFFTYRTGKKQEQNDDIPKKYEMYNTHSKKRYSHKGQKFDYTNNTLYIYIDNNKSTNSKYQQRPQIAS